jgi:hypothetical protein
MRDVRPRDMGLAFPIALLLVAVSWLVVIIGIFVSWSAQTLSPVRLWRLCLVYSVALAFVPALFFLVGGFDDASRGYFSPVPWLCLLASAVGPALSYILSLLAQRANHARSEL